ncbi:MAG TPA: hypothetical protein VEH84_12590 [Alphaproteobacteria bacterium]|nr:hypothetical protein [Alphaproteobacteria bacterium]
MSKRLLCGAAALAVLGFAGAAAADCSGHSVTAEAPKQTVPATTAQTQAPPPAEADALLLLARKAPAPAPSTAPNG